MIFALLIVIFTKDGPAPITKLFDNRFDCQVNEAVMLTAARDDKDVIGWKVVTECESAPENNKI